MARPPLRAIEPVGRRAFRLPPPAGPQGGEPDPRSGSDAVGGGGLAFAVLRAVGYVADGFFIGLLTFTLGVVTDRISFATGTLDSGLFIWAAAAQALYRWGMQSATGATLGKLLMGLRVTDRIGKPPGPLTVLAREGTLFLLVGVPSLLPIAGLQSLALLAQVVSFYLIVRRPDGRALHDLAAGTRVVPWRKLGRPSG